MKRIIILSAITCAALYACSKSHAGRHLTQSERDKANYTTIQWLDSVKNFGRAKYGDQVNVEYAFKNTGSKPLYLLYVQPTCGCIIADYTESAVMPGGKGYVKAVYNSRRGIVGNVKKSIIITSNTKNDTHFILAFTGEIVN